MTDPLPSGKTDTLPREYLDRAPSIETLRKRLDEAREDRHGNRIKCEMDRDYFDGPKQLSHTVRATLATRHQPPIYTNRVRPAVNGLMGVLEDGKRDPRAVPRNPDDENSADVCTKVLRFINDSTKFNDTQLDVAENFFIEGTGAAIVEYIDDEVRATQIRWEEFYFDPYSRRADFKDARYMGIYKWKDADEIKRMFGERINEIGDPLQPQSFSFGDSYQDRPEGMGWVDMRRRRVVLVEEYGIVDGQWFRTLYIASGVIEHGPSPYLDDKGRPTNPIEAVSCYVDRENSRYGIVRDMIPIQDEINASRSRSLHLMNSRQVQNTDPAAAPVDPETVRKEAARADGVMPMGWNVISTAEQTNANLLRMQEAKGEIERMGPTPAVLGRQEGASQSGRARLVSQQAGLTELSRPLGRLNAWVLRVYEQMWQRARQFKTDPWWIRITDDVKAPEFLQVNEPVMGPVPQPIIDPATGQPVIDPMTGQPAVQIVEGVVEVKQRLAEIDTDIILDQNNDTANLAQEIWAELMELLRLGMSPFSPEFEIAIEMSPLADKARILERLKAKREEMQQGQQIPPEVQQAIEEMQAVIADLQGGQAAAEKEKTESEAEENRAQAEKLRAEALRVMVEPFRQQPSQSSDSM